MEFHVKLPGFLGLLIFAGLAGYCTAQSIRIHNLEREVYKKNGHQDDVE